MTATKTQDRLAAEHAADIYGLTTLATTGSRWYDAGWYDGTISQDIELLGGHIIGIADIDTDAQARAMHRHPAAAIHTRFDPLAMIADCPHLDAAKIDIQGGEITLLNLTDDIWDLMPDIITMEWHTQHLGERSLAAFDGTLVTAGYTITAFDPHIDALDESHTHIIRAHRRTNPDTDA